MSDQPKEREGLSQAHDTAMELIAMGLMARMRCEEELWRAYMKAALWLELSVAKRTYNLPNCERSAIVFARSAAAIATDLGATEPALEMIQLAESLNPDAYERGILDKLKAQLAAARKAAEGPKGEEHG